MASDLAANKLIMVIIAFLLPPAAVAIKEGFGTQFIINIVLWILTFWLGGFIHALWIIFRA